MHLLPFSKFWDPIIPWLDTRLRQATRSSATADILVLCTWLSETTYRVHSQLRAANPHVLALGEPGVNWTTQSGQHLATRDGFSGQRDFPSAVGPEVSLSVELGRERGTLVEEEDWARH